MSGTVTNSVVDQVCMLVPKFKLHFASYSLFQLERNQLYLHTSTVIMYGFLEISVVSNCLFSFSFSPDDSPCTKLGCLNGGVCRTSSSGDIVCLCPLGFEGETCEKRQLIILKEDNLLHYFHVSAPVSALHWWGPHRPKLRALSAIFYTTNSNVETTVDSHTMSTYLTSLSIV